MYQIIKDIFTGQLKNKLGFKGGTLCYFFYNLPRFSTDLDFDLIEDSPTLMLDLKNTLTKRGLIKDEYDKKHTYFFLLNYGLGQHNIKIEISKKKSPLDNYTAKDFFGTTVLTMAQDSIFANKLLALHNRYKNRDIFDVHFFFENNFPINTQIIETKSGLTYKDFLQEIKKNIPKQYSSRSILAEIGELISEKQKHFVKTKLIQETLSYLDLFLSDVTSPHTSFT